MEWELAQHLLFDLFIYRVLFYSVFQVIYISFLKIYQSKSIHFNYKNHGFVWHHYKICAKYV